MGDKVRAKVRSYSIHPDKMSKLQCRQDAGSTLGFMEGPTLFCARVAPLDTGNQPPTSALASAANGVLR